jgi:hypothetical protein
MKRIFMCLLLTGILNLSYGKGTKESKNEIKGEIVCKKTGEPIPGSYVIIRKIEDNKEEKNENAYVYNGKDFPKNFEEAEIYIENQFEDGL